MSTTKVRFFIVMSADNGALEINDATEAMAGTPTRSFGPNLYAGTDDSAGIDALKQAIAEFRK